MSKIHGFKCSTCGRFIGFKDLDDGSATIEMITPDSDLSEEIFGFTCSKCLSESKSNKRQGFHICSTMPVSEFAEIQQSGWHIHKTTMKHSEYRVEIEDGICPYCGRDLG